MLNDNLEKISYNEPTKCEKCDSTDIKYDGVGEYICKKCGFLMLDDYGTVRRYIEANPGATQVEVSQATGVSKNKIRHMLRDSMIQIAPNSLVFMHCEKCGAEIRSGVLCEECSKARGKAAEEKSGRKSLILGGFSKGKTEGDGAKRFRR